MRRHRRELLNHLVGSSSVTSEEPLRNVKNALGSLRNVVGNPMFKAEVGIQCELFFYDTVAIAMVPPAGLPVGAQTSVPAFLFGLTDYYSNFVRSRQVVQPGNGWIVSSVGLVPFGVITPDAGIAGFNFGLGPMPPLLAPLFQNGDLIIFYNYNVAPFNFNAVMRIRSSGVTYGTFLNSFVSDLITVNMVRVIVPAANINQLINPLVFSYQTLFGKLTTDSIDPRMYKKPSDFQNQIADIPVTFPVDKNLAVGFSMNFDCPIVSFILSVQKVEPLTIRK